MDFHIVLNSNPWFSAVTDYSLQLARFVSSKQTSRVIYCAPAGSIALKKADQCNLKTNAIPIFPFTMTRFFAAWHALGELVKNHQPTVVWVFEGREHTLCALHRLLHRKAWRATRLVRVRGQAAAVKSSGLNKWVYTKGISGVTFAAQVIQKRTEFMVPSNQQRIHLYCTAKINEPVISLNSAPQQLVISREYSFDFVHPTLTIVGRFDPVKGHNETLQALAQANLVPYLKENQWFQIVFLGESQNISAISLFENAQKLLHCTGKALTQSRWLIEVPERRIRLLIIDERVRDIAVWMRQSSFGLIPSIGSEVICRVAVEFLQQGTPIVSSNVGALAEVLPKNCSLIYEHSQIEKLANAMEKALVLCNQPEALKMMRLNALEHGRRFGPDGWNALLSWAQALHPFAEGQNSK